MKNNHLIIETTVNRDPGGELQWYSPPPWTPGKYYVKERDPNYSSYVMVDINRPVRVLLGQAKDGYYYYSENWIAYEKPYLTFPLIEIYDEPKYNRMAISHLLLVRSSKMATVWKQGWFRGQKRD